MKVLKIIPDIKDIKTHLTTISETIAYLFVMTLLTVIFLLMMVFSYITDNILEFYDYIFKKIHIQTTIILDSILSFSKVWSKEINEKVVWPKIALTLAKLKPFVLYNETKAKLIMKDVFVND